MSGTTEDDFLEWEKGRAAPHVRAPRGRNDEKRGGGARGGRGEVRARVRAASRTPEAVVKVISYAKDRKAVRQMVEYVSRKGEPTIETKDGALVIGQEGATGTAALVEQWSANFGTRSNARNGMHVEVSAPAGTDRAAFHRAARTFGERAFGAGFDYAMAVHNDTAQPHLHFVVVRDGTEKVNLRNSKAELQHFRELMADAAQEQEQGIAMNAIPGNMRGVAEKGERMEPRKAREREGVAQVDVRAAEEVLPKLAGSKAPDQPWVEALAKRARHEALAGSFEAMAGRLGEAETGVVSSAARMVRRQSMALRQIMTRRDQMRRIAERDRLDRRGHIAEAAKTLAKAYREERARSAKRQKRTAPASEEAMQKKLATFDKAFGDRLRQLADAYDAFGEHRPPSLAWIEAMSLWRYRQGSIAQEAKTDRAVASSGISDRTLPPTLMTPALMTKVVFR